MIARRICLAFAIWSLVPLGAGGAGLPQGIAVGDVTADAAVVWARAGVDATLVFELDREPTFPSPVRLAAAVDAGDDFAAQVRFTGLDAATRYHLRVHLDGDAEAADAGSFRTAPEARTRAAVRFVVGGDLGGQAICRHRRDGYAIFRAMAALEPDFFVANGDLIYADGACPANGPDGWRNVPGDFPAIADPDVDWRDHDALRAIFFAHWRYNRADPHHQAFLRRVPMVVQWDDHEVINDFGAGWASWPAADRRPGFPGLVAAGRQAFFAYNPIARNGEERERIYRRFRWGREVELFVLDARSYRDRNDLPDGAGKTLLGAAQLAWLRDGLVASDATWKVVSSDVPLALPTGRDAHRYGRDGFANGSAEDFSQRTGAEHELLDLLRHLDAHHVRNLVVVVTDVHLAMNLRYDLDLDQDGDRLVFHELINGPLNAGREPTPPRLDPTLSPVILYGEGNLFNFSWIRVEPRADGRSALIAEIRDHSGTPRIGSRLELIAAAD